MRSLLTAAAISLAFTLFLTPVFVRLFRKWGWGQIIRTPEDGNVPAHEAKRGTPTMGGLIFIAGTLIGYFAGTYAGNFPPTISGLLVLWMMVGFGIVGFIDDYMKVHRQRSLGLTGWRKILGQVIVVVPWAIVSLNLPNTSGQTPASPYVSVFRDVPLLSFMALGVIVGWILYLLWITFIGVAWSNSTNVTDGLDGLAAGSGIFTIAAMSLVTFWQFKQSCASASLVPRTRPPATARAIRSISRSSPRPSWAHSPGSSGGARRRPRSSWVTSGRWRSAVSSPRSRSSRAPS